MDVENQHTKWNAGLVGLIGLSVTLLVLRMFCAGEITHLFLIWNLFLALIPLAIASTALPETIPLKILRWLLIVLFLPNAPYLFTDLVHLPEGSSSFYWLDFAMYFSFGLTGMTSFYLTCRKLGVEMKIPYDSVRLALYPLTALGLYLGRSGRFNSWDPVLDPTSFLQDLILLLLSEPLVGIISIASYTAYVYAFDMLIFTLSKMRS